MSNSPKEVISPITNKILPPKTSDADVDGLENEYEDILNYMGREFVQVKVRGERCMLSSAVMTGLETFSGTTYGESSGESEKQSPVYPIEYTGLLLAER